MRPLDYSCYAGASVFASTPSDLVRFGMAIHGGKLLEPTTVQLLQTSQRLASGQETGYGLGWDLKTVTLAGKPTRMAGHDGDSLGGKVATLMAFPEHGLVVAVASNISHADTSFSRRELPGSSRSDDHGKLEESPPGGDLCRHAAAIWIRSRSSRRPRRYVRNASRRATRGYICASA